MKIKVIANSAGIFAKVILALQTVKNFCDNKKINVDRISEIYFESTPNGVKNLFDHVIIQNKNDKYDTVLIARKFKTYNRMFQDNDLPFFKKLMNKVKLDNKLINSINNEITNNTLGVHIRLTDMNSLHGKNYGTRNFSDYEKIINKALSENTNITNIFVSSDNLESINKLKKKYNVIFNESISNRHTKEIDKNNEYNKFLRSNHILNTFWFDSFLDMISLSKCGVLVKGVSSLSNTSIIISDNLKKVYYV